ISENAVRHATTAHRCYMPDGIFMQPDHLRFYQYYVPDGICFPISKNQPYLITTTATRPTLTRFNHI
ncbi:hypothetical protein ACWKW6_09265, partial [Dyadobacter jiangsuensis]